MYKYLSTRLCMYALAAMDETINVNYNLTTDSDFLVDKFLLHALQK